MGAVALQNILMFFYEPGCYFGKGKVTNYSFPVSTSLAVAFEVLELPGYIDKEFVNELINSMLNS